MSTTTLGPIWTLVGLMPDHTGYSSVTDLLLGCDPDVSDPTYFAVAAIAQEAERQLVEAGYTTLGNGEVVVTLTAPQFGAEAVVSENPAMTPSAIFERAREAISTLY
ncbi:hypothetical protein [Kineococcus terrestris]|uniref:hypothetical protein n=1 Tax=Kineococcus terrestris TaxID=2044856 RepID=UPI0034DB40FB